MFKKIKYSDDLLGTRVSVITNKNAEQRGFKVGKVYEGELLSKKDWMVGCPVFKCDEGVLGLDYECNLVAKEQEINENL